MSKLLIDVGSTYFKIASKEGIEQRFRDFSTDIHSDLMSKFGETIQSYDPQNVHICSSANGGLSTLIIGLTKSFSLKYATNIAFNSGINIIDTILYHNIEKSVVPGDLLDVVIIVGGIDGISEVYDTRLVDYISKLNFNNIVYVGTAKDAGFIKEQIPEVVVLANIIDNKLKMQESELKDYLTNLYQKDIMGKEEIKALYELTSNQIFPTPYVVNKSLPFMDASFDVVNPFIVLDIGGATTDIHYSRDLVKDNLISQSGFDRLVFKKLGVYKSKESLILAAKNNEFVYELLAHLDITENIFEENSDESVRILMLLSIFLVLYKVSLHHNAYVDLHLEKLESMVFTGGITKVLSQGDVQSIVHFFYKKVLMMQHIPTLLLDSQYSIWTLGVQAQEKLQESEDVN